MGYYISFTREVPGEEGVWCVFSKEVTPICENLAQLVWAGGLYL